MPHKLPGFMKGHVRRWGRVKNQCGLWKEENLIEFSRAWQMEAGSRICAHTDTRAQRGYKHTQNRRYLGFNTKRDVTLMQRSQVGWEPRAEAELSRVQFHRRHFRQEMTDSVSEAGSTQGQAIHLQPDFCSRPLSAAHTTLGVFAPHGPHSFPPSQWDACPSAFQDWIILLSC